MVRVRSSKKIILTSALIGIGAAVVAAAVWLTMRSPADTMNATSVALQKQCLQQARNTRTAALKQAVQFPDRATRRLNIYKARVAYAEARTACLKQFPKKVEENSWLSAVTFDEYIYEMVSKTTLFHSGAII